jgi:RNA polymerase sigma-70 factor (ECF subfamily)
MTRADLASRLPEALAQRIAESSEASERLRAYEEAAAAASDLIVELELDADETVDYLAERLANACEEREDLARAIAGLQPEALVLALAASLGREEGIRRFEERFFSALRPALGKMRLDQAAMDEVHQLVRERLFVPAAGKSRARIAELAGQGDLRALVRLSGVRIALNLKRRDKRLVPDDDEAILSTLAADDDPELAVLKSRYRRDVKAAFESALAQLSARERAVLRLHLIHRVSIDEIGEIYRVHRATAARWLARVRSQLDEATRQALRDALGVESEDLASVIRLVQSRLEVSFDRLLQSDAAD